MHISFQLSHFLKPLFPVHDSTLLLVCGLKHQKMTQIIYLMFSWKMDTSFYSVLSNNPTCWISFVCFDSYRLHLCPAAVHVGQLKCNKSIKSGVQNSTLRCQTLRLLFTLSYTQLAFLLFAMCAVKHRGIFLIWLNTETSLAIIPAVFPSHKQWLHQLLFLDLFSWFMVYTVKYQETNTRVK